MKQIFGMLKVFFEDPFWIAIVERMEEGKLTACKIPFGAEPKDYEVYEFFLKHYDKLRFSPPVTAVMMDRKRNPKRIQREVRKQLSEIGMGTKSQQALKLQREQGIMERKAVSREEREAEKQRQFDIRQQKKKEKHKGR